VIRRQQTIAGPIEFEGHGLHSGQQVRASLHPALEGAGLTFRRTDLEGAPAIPATVDQVTAVEWETALGSGEARVGCVEHVLAAVYGLGIDNLRLDVFGPEPPALDGSAAVWCERIAETGLVSQDAPSRSLVVRTPIHVESGSSSYAVLPYDGYRVSGRIDFDHPLIGTQFASCEVESSRFQVEMADARTFGLAAWESELHGKGLALGATTSNTVVLGDEGLEGGCSLRYPDEFVRHKLLDIVGDLALVGARLDCHIVAERPGHKGNIAVAKRLRRTMAGEDPAFDIRKILEFMPHRYPMLLVDRILEFEEGHRVVGLKNVTINEPFFAGHFPGHPVMPGVLIIEALAQCGGILLMNEVEDPDDKVVYFMSLDDVKFRRPVTPGDQLIFELELLRAGRKVCKMSGRALVDGQVAAEATMVASVVDR